MVFEWNYENLLAEVEQLDSADPFIHLEISALVHAINIARDGHLISASEALTLIVKLLGLPYGGKPS